MLAQFACRETYDLALSRRKKWHWSDLANSGRFSSIAPVNRTNWKQYFEFTERDCNIQCSSNPNRYTLFGYKLALSVVSGDTSVFLRTFFLPRCCEHFIFHRLWSLFSKIGLFLLCLSSESPIETWYITFFMANRETPKYSRIQVFQIPYNANIWDVWNIFAMSRALWPDLSLTSLFEFGYRQCRFIEIFSTFESRETLMNRTFSYSTIPINGTYHFFYL